MGPAAEVARRIRDSGGRAVVLRADLTDEDACRRLVAEAADWGDGRLTALVNNAGVQPTHELPGMTTAQWRSVVDTNLSTVFACTQAAAEVMRERGEGGSVTHTLEYGPHGIRVNTVSPGLIDREGLEDAWPEGVHRWQRAAPPRPTGPPGGRGRRVCVPGLRPGVVGHGPGPGGGRRGDGAADVVTVAHVHVVRDARVSVARFASVRNREVARIDDGEAT